MHEMIRCNRKSKELIWWTKCSTLLPVNWFGSSSIFHGASHTTRDNRAKEFGRTVCSLGSQLRSQIGPDGSPVIPESGQVQAADVVGIWGGGCSRVRTLHGTDERLRDDREHPDYELSRKSPGAFSQMGLFRPRRFVSHGLTNFVKLPGFFG